MQKRSFQNGPVAGTILDFLWPKTTLFQKAVAFALGLEPELAPAVEPIDFVVPDGAVAGCAVERGFGSYCHHEQPSRTRLAPCSAPFALYENKYTTKVFKFDTIKKCIYIS